MTKVGEVTGSRDAQPAAEAPGQRGLPRAQRPDQDHQVAGHDDVGERRAQPLGVLDGRQQVLGLHAAPPSERGDGGQVGQQPGPGRALRPEPDRRRRVVGRPDRPPVHLVRPAADGGEHGAGPEEPLRRREPQRDHDGCVEELELAAQPAAAARHLRGLRRPVARRPALHDVEHRRLRAVQPGLGQQLVEQLAGLPDEGPSGLVLGGTRRLADQHQPRPARRRARHRRRRAAGSAASSGQATQPRAAVASEPQSGAAAAVRATSSAGASRRGERGAAATRAP